MCLSCTKPAALIRTIKSFQSKVRIICTEIKFRLICSGAEIRLDTKITFTEIASEIKSRLLRKRFLRFKIEVTEFKIKIINVRIRIRMTEVMTDLG